MGDKKAKFDIKALLQADVSTLFKKSNHESQKAKKAKKVETKKEVVVFDIGAKSINIVVGKYVKDRVVVNKCFNVQTPTDVYEDGRVLNEASLGNTLQLALKENGIKAKDAIITTNSSQIINRELVIKKVADDEMETVIRFEMQQYLPINLNDYLVRYMVIDEFEEDGSEKVKVYAISYPDRLAKSYYGLVKAAGLKPFTLETTYFSLNKLINQTKLINSKPFDYSQTTAFLDIGSATIDVNIYKHKNIDLTRIIKVGGDTVDNLLSQRHSIPLNSALSVKRQLDLSEIHNESLETETVKLAVDNIVYEIDRIFQFYKNKSFSTIDQVYIYGGASKLASLDLYMSEKLGVSVETVTHVDSIEFKEKNEDVYLQDYLNTIGAIIRL